MHQHHDIDPWLTGAACCPSCGRPAESGTAGWSTCACGRSWPTHPAEIPAAARDDLGAAALTVDRLRSYLHGPVTPAERVAARRRLDGPAQHVGLDR